MKGNKTAIIAFVLLLITSSVYRVIPGLPAGLAPQLAMAIFGGAVFSDRKIALLVPLLSLFLSDLLFHVLFLGGMAPVPGFYDGQVSNYILFMLLTLFGSLMKKKNLIQITFYTTVGSLLYFLASNFLVWFSGAGYARPKTFDGLMLCYGDGLAFYRDYGWIHGFSFNFIIGDLAWSFLLFGVFVLLTRPAASTRTQVAREY
ncbi:MAG: hypothetical protein EOO09_06620 [Chitinophagaceae bacterium]|nr:MAG: hypothetical protein EOO09_06620 [Chitinophagaceae bacterium]